MKTERRLCRSPWLWLTTYWNWLILIMVCLQDNSVVDWTHYIEAMITCRLKQLNHFRFTNSLPVLLQVIVGSVFISLVYSCNPRSFPHFLHWRRRRIWRLRCRVDQKPAEHTLVVSAWACFEISDRWRWLAGDCQERLLSAGDAGPEVGL